MTFPVPAIISIKEEWAGCDRPPYEAQHLALKAMFVLA